jgi:hypothetical protein
MNLIIGWDGYVFMCCRDIFIFCGPGGIDGKSVSCLLGGLSLIMFLGEGWV